MPARIIVVLDEPDIAEKVAASLRTVDYGCLALPDSMAAVNALEQANRIELLITSIDFAPGCPNGISLALMVRNRRPDVKVVFVGPLEMGHFVVGLGDLVPTPTTADEIVARGMQKLAANGNPA